MRAFLFQHVEHVLCVLLLLARIGDVTTTWLVTPTLRLEANPIVRKLRWPFAWATLLACALPYYNQALGFAVLVGSLFVCFWNATKIWIARALGEHAYASLLESAAKESRLRDALIPYWIALTFLGAVGALLVLFSSGPTDWGFWGGVGIEGAAGAMLVHGSLYYRRLFRRAKTS